MNIFLMLERVQNHCFCAFFRLLPDLFQPLPVRPIDLPIDTGIIQAKSSRCQPQDHPGCPASPHSSALIRKCFHQHAAHADRYRPFLSILQIDFSLPQPVPIVPDAAVVSQVRILTKS
jgi:hypothetical protein